MKKIIKLIRQRKEEEKVVFVCGNGGSASTAEHFTNDLFSKGVRAVCLNSNVAIMTMIANDFGYKYVFQKQLEIYADPKDLLIVFSGSGNSENIIEALRQGMESIAILGKGGKAKSLANHVLLAPYEDYEPIEDEHLIIAHQISKKI